MVGEREFYGKHRDKTLLRPSGFGGQAKLPKLPKGLHNRAR